MRQMEKEEDGNHEVAQVEVVLHEDRQLQQSKLRIQNASDLGHVAGK